MTTAAPPASDDGSNANNGMMTRVWGPPGWFFLHCVTFGYPVDPAKFDEERDQVPGTTAKAYNEFFMRVGDILPCKYCRESYKKFIRELPPDVTNRDTLVEWFWAIHNKVNEKLEDKYDDASLEQIKERYERYRAKCSTKQVARGCAVPVTGKKMCTVIKPVYCDERDRYNMDCINLAVIMMALFIGRILFGIFVDGLLSKGGTTGQK